MLNAGTPAPPFELTLVGGGRASASQLSADAKPSLLVFFKTECPTCRLAFPFLQRIWKRVEKAPHPAGFLAIAQNAPADIPGFMAGYGATFPVATESEPYATADRYEIANVPSIFLLDEHGVILQTAVGFARHEYDALAEELLSRAGAGKLGSLFTAADASVPVLQPG
jgi:peroxiredoxin